MPTPVVWSERPEPNAAGLKDCTYSAGLMGLVYGGKTDFQIGIYTVAEREALERSDNQPNETGASLDDLIVAIKRRYGIALTKYGDPVNAVRLTQVGRALIVQGINANLPKGHPQRRWDPTFGGGHCVCAIPLGGGKTLWLDPLAPNKFTGDTVANAVVLQWANGSGAVIPVIKDRYAPRTYTEAEMAAVKAELAKCEAERNAAQARIAAAKVALG